MSESVEAPVGTVNSVAPTSKSANNVVAVVPAVSTEPVIPTTAVFTFGRFQPPTTGHEVLIRGLIDLAIAREADAYVFVSSTHGTRNLQNPLTVAQKVAYMRKQYPAGLQIVDTTVCGCKTLPSIVDMLLAKGYSHVVLGVGSDRVPGFKRIFAKEERVEVVPIGQKRTNRGNSLAAMSGTKMRLAATRGNLNAFTRGVKIGSMTNENAASLMANVRTGLGLSGGSKKKRKTRKRQRRFELRD
jgi:hypothetical protein